MKTRTRRGQHHLEHRIHPVPHWRLTPASGEIHSEILIVHGLGEHAGRMLPLASDLADRGFACRLPDLPGHGGDGSDAHQQLMRCYLDSADASQTLKMIGEMDETDRQHLESVRQNRTRELNSTCFDSIIEAVERCFLWSGGDGNESRRPHFIWAHSMGGLAAIRALEKIDRDMASAPKGLVLTAPALAPPPFADDLLSRLASAKAYFMSTFPPLKPLAFLQRLTARALDLQSDGRWASQHVSDLPDEQELHPADPLQQLFLPMCFLGRLLPSMGRAHSRVREVRTPTYAIAPGFDPIVNNNGLLRWAPKLRESLDPERPHRLARYEDLCVHDLARSSAADDVINCATEWLMGTGTD